MKISAVKTDNEFFHDLSEKELARLIANGRLNGSEKISLDGKKWVSLRDHPKYNRWFSVSNPQIAGTHARCSKCGWMQVRRDRCRNCGSPLKSFKPSSHQERKSMPGRSLSYTSRFNPYVGEGLSPEDLGEIKTEVLLKEENLLGIFLAEVPLKLKKTGEGVSSSREIFGVTDQRVFIYLPHRPESEGNIISFSLGRINKFCSYKNYFSCGWGFRINAHWIFFDNFKEPEAEKAIELIRLSSGLTLEDRVHLGHEIDPEILTREISPILRADEKLLGAFLGHACWPHGTGHPNPDLHAFQRDCLVITQSRVIFYHGRAKEKPELGFKTLPYEAIINIEDRDNVLYGDIVFNLKGVREKFEYIMESDFPKAFKLIQKYLAKTKKKP